VTYVTNFYKILSWIKEIDPTIIHIHGLAMSTVGYLLSKFINKKYICSINDRQ